MTGALTSHQLCGDDRKPIAPKVLLVACCALREQGLPGHSLQCEAEPAPATRAELDSGAALAGGCGLEMWVFLPIFGGVSVVFGCVLFGPLLQC